MTGLIVDVRYSSHFRAIGLVIHVLECVLVKVDWCWAEALRRRLVKLILNALEAMSNSLRRQKFINCASVVCRAKLQLF